MHHDVLYRVSAHFICRLMYYIVDANSSSYG